MATRGKDGSVEIQVTGDTSPLEASVAAAKAKVEAEGSTGKVGAASTQAAADVAKVGVAATASTEALNQMGQAGEKAVGAEAPLQGGLKGLNKTLGDTVGQVQGLIGKFTIVAGVATGMYALGRAIRESVVSALETGTEKAEKFAESLDLSKKAESIKSISDEINKLSGELTAQETNPLDRAVGFFTGTNPEKLKEEITRLNKLSQSLRDNEQAARRRKERDDESKAYLELQQSRMKASEEYDDLVQKSLDKESEARDSQIEDFRKSMQELGDEMTKQAKRSQEAWVDSLRAIREESNRAFNTDQAATMVQLAGNLRTTATIATANMNRIVVGGDD
jgi:hypothetical protein